VNGRVLITGGAGFIGMHLARCLLAADYKVTLVDNHARGIRDQDFEELISASAVSFSEVDLLNLDSVCALGSSFCAIFHLAAIIGVSHVTKRPYEVLVQNTRMLENVLTLAPFPSVDRKHYAGERS
jgi:nucleoside-diphosphate-sugar epimerase